MDNGVRRTSLMGSRDTIAQVLCVRARVRACVCVCKRVSSLTVFVCVCVCVCVCGARCIRSS